MVRVDFQTLWQIRRWGELVSGKISERDYIRVYVGRFNLSIAEVQQLYDSYFYLSLDETLAILRRLPFLGHGILSNHYSRAWEWLRRHDLLDMIPESHILLSSEIGVAKPDVAAYELALKRLNKDPGSIVFIDNMQRNLVPAQILRMHAMRFGSPIQLCGELARLGVHGLLAS